MCSKVKLIDALPFLIQSLIEVREKNTVPPVEKRSQVQVTFNSLPKPISCKLA